MSKVTESKPPATVHAPKATTISQPAKAAAAAPVAPPTTAPKAAAPEPKDQVSVGKSDGASTKSGNQAVAGLKEAFATPAPSSQPSSSAVASTTTQQVASGYADFTQSSAPPSSIEAKNAGGSQKLAELNNQVAQSNDPKFKQQAAKQLTDAFLTQRPPVNFDKVSSDFSGVIGNGQGVDLSLGIVSELKKSGRDKEAQKLEAGIASGTSALGKRLDTVSGKVSDVQLEQAYLKSQFGPLGTADQQKQADQNFLGTYPEYQNDLAERERLAKAYQGDLKKLAQDPNTLDVDLVRAQANLAAHLDSFAASDFGAKTLAGELQARAQGGSSPVIEAVTAEQVLATGGSQLKSSVGQTLLESAKDSALNSLGEPGGNAKYDAILRGLATFDDSRSTQLFGANQDQVAKLADAAIRDRELAQLGELNRADSSELSQEGRDRIGTARGGLKALSGQLQKEGAFELSDQANLFRIGLGAYSLFNSPTPTDELGALSTLAKAGNLGSDSLKLLGGVLGHQTLADSAGKASKGLGTAAATIDFVRFVSSKPEVGEVPGGLARFGGSLALSLSSNPATIAGGAALFAAGSLYDYQYHRVQASNQHENKHTEAYLSGIFPGTDKAKIKHLRNADKDGVNIGIALQRLSELQTGAADSGLAKKLVDQLEPGQVLEATEAAHRVVSASRDSAGSLPATGAYDNVVGSGVISAGDGQSYYLKNGSQFRLIPANQVSDKTYPGTGKQRVIFPDSVAGLRNYYLQRFPQLANLLN